MSVNFRIESTESRIEGFEKLTSSLVMGQLTLRERLLKQCEKLKLQMTTDSGTKNTYVLFDDCVYSDSLLLKMKKQPAAVTLEIETTWNAAITFLKQPLLKNVISGDPRAQAQFVPQEKLLCVDLNLPETVYPEKDYHVVATDLFFQKIQTWKDLIISQSLIAREFTSQTVGFWKRLLPTSISKWLFQQPALAQTTNQIGKNCRIHPTAILESCVIGDNVEIGAFCYLRACVIGSNVTVREKSSIKLSVIGSGSYILPTDIFNCYLGQNVTLTTHILFHCVIGDSTFIGGGVGFADLNASKNSIQIKSKMGSASADSGHLFLGSCVGEHCFIGAGLLFHVGQLVPHHTTLLNYNMIQKDQFLSQKTYVSNNGKITQIPTSFLNNQDKTSEKNL